MMHSSIEEETLLAQTAAFARDVVAPQAIVWERQRRIGRDAFAQAARIGLTRLEVPRAMGGLGMPYSVKAKVADLLGAADFAFTMSLVNRRAYLESGVILFSVVSAALAVVMVLNWMRVVMLTLLALQAFSGLFNSEDAIFQGPLYYAADTGYITVHEHEVRVVPESLVNSF